MPDLENWTPDASRGTRLFLAATAWTAVGVGLGGAGLLWLSGYRAALALPVLALAVAAGYAKGRLILAPRARANAERIVASAERRCFGGFFSRASWTFVVVMMAAGAILRRSPIPRIWLGCLYAAVGTALVVGSAAAWGGWRRFRRPESTA